MDGLCVEGWLRKKQLLASDKICWTVNCISHSEHSEISETPKSCAKSNRWDMANVKRLSNAWQVGRMSWESDIDDITRRDKFYFL